MNEQVLLEGAKVTKIVGDVLVIDSSGDARVLKVGDVIHSNEVIITAKNSKVEFIEQGETITIDENCAACSLDQGPINAAPIDGLVSVDIEQNSELDLAALEAIQQAILDGEDPTAILEAAAAGGVLGSANAGFITIEYNNPELLAKTFFETSAATRDQFDDPEEDGRSTVFAAGGESISELLVEGDFDANNGYPTEISTSITIEAGDLPLDADSLFLTQPLFQRCLMN